MVRISPFRALRPNESMAPRVASVPYDVVNTEEARALAEGNPHSFLHVVRPEIDLPTGTDVYADAVYEQARANLDGLRANGILKQDDQPAIYIYRLVREGRAQTGVVCCCHIDDYAKDRIRKHEKTRPDKEDDRTRHALTLMANAGPVFLTYRDNDRIAQLINHDNDERPIVHFVAPDGVTHTVWKSHAPAEYVKMFAEMEAVYVADGHHRSASAARAGAELRTKNKNHTGEEEYNWFLSVLFPASELTILAYNRIVTDIGDRSPDEVLDELRKVGTLSETSDPTPDRAGVFCFYLDGKWYRLEIDPASIDHDDVIASLDVSVLSDRVLQPVFGIEDQRTDQRIDFVGGIRGTKELEKRVDSGEAKLAISMFPTSIEQLLAVSDAGKIMPPKSTWFEPKLRSGLFVHLLE